MLDGVVVVVLELGVDPQHRQPDPADAAAASARTAASSTATVAWPPSGWKSASWAVRISTLPCGVVDDGRAADELHRGVVAGRHAVLVGAACLGPPVGRDVGVVADHRQPDLGGCLQVRPDRVRPGQMEEQLVRRRA